MEGRRCRSCPNQNTSSTDNALQSHSGTCTEENRGPQQALCTVKWMDADWQEPTPCALVHPIAHIFWMGTAASSIAYCQCQAQHGGLHASVVRLHLDPLFKASCNLCAPNSKNNCKWCLVRVFSIFQESLKAIYCTIWLI